MTVQNNNNNNNNGIRQKESYPCYALISGLPWNRKKQHHQSVLEIVEQPSTDDTEEMSDKESIEGIEEYDEGITTSTNQEMTSETNENENVENENESDDPNDDIWNLDGVDVVEKWGEAQAVAYARSACRVWLPTTQPRLIEIFVREGFDIVNISRQVLGESQPTSIGGNPINDNNENDIGEGDEQFGGSGNDEKLDSQCWFPAFARVADLMRKQSRRNKDDTKIHVWNQRGDVGRVCKSLGKPAYFDMKFILEETTLSDLKAEVHDRWDTPFNQQFFFTPIGGVERTKELDCGTGGDDQLLISFGLREGDTIFLRHKKKEGSFEVRVSPPLPFYYPFSALFKKFRGLEFPFSDVVGCISTNLFDPNSEEDTDFRPFFQLTLRNAKSLRVGRSNPILSVDASIEFGVLRNGISSDPNIRGFFVHADYFVMRLSDGTYPFTIHTTASVNAATNVSSTATRSQNQNDSNSLQAGFQGTAPAIGANIGVGHSMGREDRVSSESSPEEFFRYKFGTRYMFKRNLWCPASFPQHHTYYDNVPTTVGIPTIPLVNCTYREDFPLKWVIENEMDFLGFVPSMVNLLSFGRYPKNMKDRSNVIIEAKMLLRKIHTVDIPTSDGGRGIKQNVDSYREVVIRQNVPISRFRRPLFASLLAWIFVVLLLYFSFVVLICIWKTSVAIFGIRTIIDRVLVAFTFVGVLWLGELYMHTDADRKPTSKNDNRDS